MNLLKRKAAPFKGKIKILAIADTHNNLTKEKIEKIKNIKYDICILLGDISKGDLKLLLKQVPKEKMIGILGNHDDKDNLEIFGIKNINNSIYYYNDISFFGLEGCIKYKETQPGYTLKESKLILKKAPRAEILISHNIPYKFMGEINNTHIGNPEINKYLERTRCPVCICGHNHTIKNEKLKNGTTVIETYEITLIEINKENIIIDIIT